MFSAYLPAELWIVVFEHASHVPGLFDVSSLDPLENEVRAWSHHETYQIIQAISTKNVLVQVCKLWRNAGIHLLYEHIFVSRPSTWRLFKRMLKRRMHDHPLSCYTKRIDLYQYNSIWINLEKFSRHLHYLKNLKILTFNVGHCNNSVGGPYAKLPLRISSSSVRYFRWWAQSPYYVASTPPIRHLDGASMLSVLELEFAESKGSDPSQFWAGDVQSLASFPCLHTMRLLSPTVGFLLWLVSSTTTASLRSLHLDLDKPVISACTTFLRERGSNIDYLKISLPNGTDLSFVFTYCPKLQQLICSYAPNVDKSQVHHTVSRIAFPPYNVNNWSVADPVRRAELLSILRPHFPRLKRITLLRWYSPSFNIHEWSAADRSNWTIVLEKFRDTGVSLHFGNGELVKIPELKEGAAGFEVKTVRANTGHLVGACRHIDFTKLMIVHTKTTRLLLPQAQTSAQQET
jgi:hypothetical protein